MAATSLTHTHNIHSNHEVCHARRLFSQRANVPKKIAAAKGSKREGARESERERERVMRRGRNKSLGRDKVDPVSEPDKTTTTTTARKVRLKSSRIAPGCVGVGRERAR